MAELYVSPDQAVGELVVAARSAGADPGLLPWTAMLADRLLLPIRLIRCDTLTANLDAALERKLIRLRTAMPALRIESRTMQRSCLSSTWLDELRPHSLPMASASRLPSMAWPPVPAATVVLGPNTSSSPETGGSVLAVLDQDPVEADRVQFVADSLGRALDRPTRSLPMGAELDPVSGFEADEADAGFTTVSASSPHLDTLVARARHPLLVVGG